MPGIAGLIRKRETAGHEPQILTTMIGCMRHEPFYTQGTFSSPENGFFIGYTALEGSFSDCMPIWNETRDKVLFLTGECYTDRAPIDRLAGRGHVFDAETAAYIVHLYEEEGDGLFPLLNGWYNGILLDLRLSKATLFNDRCGIRRIYFHEDDDVFAFSSEAKSLLKAFPRLRKADLFSMGEFLTFDCVLNDRSYFSDIFLLPPGSAWSFQKGKWTKRKYFDTASLEHLPKMKREPYVQELGETFQRVLPRYFSGGRIGMSLTGGLDTRSVMACLHPAPGQLPCYTFGGTYKDILDVRIAPKVAKICGQSHSVLRLDDSKFLSEYPSLVERSAYITDGLESVDMTDVISFNKLAREVSPIRMTGKYGSQILKGIAGFQARPPESRIINKDFLPYLKTTEETGSQLQKGHQLSFVLGSVIPWWWNGIIASESSQVSVRSPFLDNDLINVLYQAPDLEPGFGINFELGLIAQSKPELMALPTTGTYGGNHPGIISKSVKTALLSLMLLDKIYVRERLPYNMTHVVARLDHILSPLHLDRMVTGFVEFRRYRIWFRDQLAGYLRDMLLDSRTLDRPYWDKKQLTQVVNDHIHGRGNYLREIRKALQIELIHRVLLEG